MEVDFRPGFDLDEDDDDDDEIVNASEDLFPLRDLDIDPSSTPPPAPSMERVGPGPGIIPFQIGSIGRRKRAESGQNILGRDRSDIEEHEK